jgi:probable HAF family extracellular repeat protein
LSAFRWRAATGLERLPLYDGSDVSADGSVIVSLGVRWTDAGGSQPLGDFGGGYTAALGVSPDGGVVVGYSENAAREARAFRWTAATGLRDLGTNGGAEALASDTSMNGSVVVGQSRNKDFFWQAFRWTAAGGIQNLRTLGGPMSAAYAVSDNGSVIVGKSLLNSSSGSERAFRWTTRRGMQELQRELMDAGVSAVGGWVLTSASAVSADGTVMVGTGLNPSRQWEAFPRHAAGSRLAIVEKRQSPASLERAASSCPHGRPVSRRRASRRSASRLRVPRRSAGRATPSRPRGPARRGARPGLAPRARAARGGRGRSPKRCRPPR